MIENAAVVGYRLRLAIGEALSSARRARVDRYDVAMAMSRLSGTGVTKNMIDRWAAPGNEMHRMPAELLPALVAATGDRAALEVLAEACGCALVDHADRRLVAIGKVFDQLVETGSIGDTP